MSKRVSLHYLGTVVFFPILGRWLDSCLGLSIPLASTLWCLRNILSQRDRTGSLIGWVSMKDDMEYDASG